MVVNLVGAFASSKSTPALRQPVTHEIIGNALIARRWGLLRPNNLIFALCMLELEKITILYSEEQDRIAINAEVRDGGTARIWLTQRMTNRLVPALINVIKPHHEDAIYVDVIAGVAQQKAISRQELQAPVKVVEPTHEWLVSKVDLQMPTSGVIVVFYSLTAQSARVAFNADLLRQWLSILQRVCATAEWRGTEWPDWLALPSETRGAGRVLH